MARRRHTCAWCPDTFATVTDHLVHLHEAHPDTFGRGRTRSCTWSCWRCASENAPTATTCTCGWVHPYATEAPR